jgi:hypothetical protein
LLRERGAEEGEREGGVVYREGAMGREREGERERER